MIDPNIPALTPSMSSDNLELAWKNIASAGYFIGDDRLLGMPEGFRKRLHGRYFTEGVLKRYPDDIPADRERARDVIRYEWATRDRITLASHHVVSIGDRHGRRGPQHISRVELVHDNEFAAWAAGILALVPPGRRLTRGTFGVNLFRTRTQVVTGPHQDHEQFIVVYVLDKIGTGAETSLHDVHDVHKVAERTTLRPGEFVIFDDTRFKHSASRLIAPPGGQARRDVLVCTVNFADTYPLG